MKEIKEVKSELEVIDEEKYRGAVLRKRAHRLWMGETSTKRAMSDEKKHAVSKEIMEIRYQGQVTKDVGKIEHAFQSYYKSLMGKNTCDVERFKTYFLPLMPTLSDEVCEALNRPISVSEVGDAIDDLSPGKSPGPDGLEGAFYKSFKSAIAVALYRMIEEMYENKEAPPSFRTAHVILIPKSRDRARLLDVEAYRPISLTNTDYKVYTKILVRRLQTVIKELVGPHQTCGIKGRSIFSNIHTARAILESCDEM